MKTKLVLGAVAAVFAGYLFFGGGGDDDDRKDRDEQALHSEQWLNQVWIDKLPVRETDKMNFFLIIDDPELGIFQSASQWEGDYTIFGWKKKAADKVEIEMMQTGKKHKLKFIKSTDCGRFDLCMEVKGAPRGPKMYYSMEEWVVDGEGLTGNDLALEARKLVN